jgi:Rrf2 family protein
MTQLTRASDYAVRVIMYMAILPQGTVVRMKTLATEVAVPESFLAKVLQVLTRSGFLVSRRGPEGGFELPPNTLQATILDIVNAVDGPVQLNVCLGESGNCDLRNWCPAYPIWAEAQIAMLSVLSRETISDMVRNVPKASSPKNAPRRSSAYPAAI